MISFGEVGSLALETLAIQTTRHQQWERTDI